MVPMIEERHKGTPMAGALNLLTNGECALSPKTRGRGAKPRYISKKWYF